MAKRPGPPKGEGGAPRKPPSAQAKTAAGYQQQTIGAPGKGRRVYVQREVAYGGAPPKSRVGPKAGLVDHKDGNRTNNSPRNLHVVNSSQNSKNRHPRKS